MAILYYSNFQRYLSIEFLTNFLSFYLDENEEVSKKLDKFFSNGVIIYNGYVDDIRNTDNAWIETSAINYHDDEGIYFEFIISINANYIIYVYYQELD